MKARIHIFLKEEILDPPGETIARELSRLGIANIKRVHVGKAIDIEFEGPAPKETLEEMCNQLLVNPVIEEATLSTLPEAP